MYNQQDNTIQKHLTMLSKK